MRVEIGTHLAICLDDLPPGILPQLKSALTIPNGEKEVAVREKVWGAEQLPDTISLYEDNGRTLYAPRGFLRAFMSGMQTIGQDVDVRDTRVRYPVNISGNFIELRGHQEPAVEAIMSHAQGIYQAPPASGKTVTVLEVIRRAQQRSLILVDKVNIATQWKNRCETFLGFSPGIIGDGLHEEDDVTIALMQTLWARRDELLQTGWFRKWGLVCLDECHHVTANTYSQVIQDFPAQYRFGVSATPKREEWTYPIATTVLGPVIHETTKDELRGGILMKPTVEVVKTGFEYQFQSTYVDANNKIKRNNYGRMMAALVKDTYRNELIVRKLWANHLHCNLVLSKRLNHLTILRDALIGQGLEPERALLLTGKQSRDERDEIAALADSGRITIFSTIADEALDIPRLDRLYLTWPTRKPAVIRQQVGRVERVHPQKTESIIYDFVDWRVGVLKSQYLERVKDVYRAEELDLYVNGERLR